MRTKVTLVVLAVLFSLNGFSQNWLWARQATGTGSQEGVSSAVDAFGNVYATGLFYYPSVTFDSITLPNAGQYDMFLVKYSSVGAVLWARGVGGNGNDQGWSVTTDSLGDAYVTGYFNSPTMIFGSDTLINTGVWKMFVVKYSSTGNLLWARSGEGGSSVKGNSITINSAGNIYVTGNFNGTLIFGSDTLTNTGISDIFIVEYSSSGTVLMAKSAGGNGNSYGNSIASDAFGNIFITGYFSGTSITFDATTISNSDLTGNTDDMFIAKYTDTGSLIWAHNATGTDYDRANSVSADNLANAYVTGFSKSSPIIFGSDTLTNAGNYDMFIVKYSPSGMVMFAKTIGGINNEMGWSVATDISGVYVTGGFASPFVIFDYDTLYFPTGATDPMFMIKYDSTLNVMCASVLASGGDDWSGLSTDGNGDVYVAGDIFGTIPIIVGADTLSTTTSLQELFFIAKYNCGSIESVNEFSDEEEIIISPNPATNQFTISDLPFTISEIEMYNVLGEKCLTVTHPQPPLSGASAFAQRGLRVDVSSLIPGVYFVRLASEKEQVTRKVVVQR